MFVHVLATETAPTGGLPFDPFTLILLALFGFLIFTMFRRQKKAKRVALEQKSQIAPGVEVMTQFGLFGTVVSMDTEENKVVLEIAPGSHATVHLQTITKIITPETVPEESAGAPAETPVVPNDASALVDPQEAPMPKATDETPGRLNDEKKNNES